MIIQYLPVSQQDKVKLAHIWTFRFDFCRSTWPNIKETSHTNVRFAPSSSTTRRTCGGTCACTQVRSLSPVMFAAKVLYARIAWSNIRILTRKSNPYSWHDNKWILVSHPVGEESNRRGHQRLCQLMLEAVIGGRRVVAKPPHTRRRTPIQLRRRPRQPPPPSVPPISFDYHYYYYYYWAANVLQPCCKQLLPENKNYKHATHTHMNDDYCSQCEEKQNKNQETCSLLTRKKKLKTKRKQTLLQLTTYVMCHKLNSDFSKLCLLSWPDALEFWRKIKKKWISHKKFTQMP